MFVAKKACNHPMLILNSGYRQVTMRINKQEQFTPPNGREPSELLALVREYFAGIRIERDKSRKLKLSKKTSNGIATLNFIVNNKNCLS